MALLGQGFRPELGVYDYSGITRANEMMGQATANFGKQIGDGIQDYSKEQKELQADIAKGKTSLAHFKTLNPELSDKIDELGSIFKDPTKSKVEQAAAGKQMSDDVASFISSQRYGKEFAMKERELATNERAANDAHNASSYTLGAAQNKDEANRIVNSTIGPAKIQSAIDMLKKAGRGDLLASMPDVSAMAPDMQSAIADALIELAPARVKTEFVAKFPVPGGSLPAVFDPSTGTASPVLLDGMVLPPKDGVAGLPIIPDVSPADQELKGLQIEKAKQDINTVDQTKEDKAKAEAGTVAKSGEMLAALTKLENHPGFNNLFGSNVGTPTWMPGTAGADAKALFNQVEGKGFIEAIQEMKGMGALSNAEGEKASMSYLGLTPAMSEDAAKTRIKELKSLVEQGIQRQKSGQLVNPDGTPKLTTVQNTPGTSAILNAWQNRPRQ